MIEMEYYRHDVIIGLPFILIFLVINLHLRISLLRRFSANMTSKKTAAALSTVIGTAIPMKRVNHKYDRIQVMRAKYDMKNIRLF